MQTESQGKRVFRYMERCAITLEGFSAEQLDVMHGLLSQVSHLIPMHFVEVSIEFGGAEQVSARARTKTNCRYKNAWIQLCREQFFGMKREEQLTVLIHEICHMSVAPMSELFYNRIENIIEESRREVMREMFTDAMEQSVIEMERVFSRFIREGGHAKVS